MYDLTDAIDVHAHARGQDGEEPLHAAQEASRAGMKAILYKSISPGRPWEVARQLQTEDEARRIGAQILSEEQQLETTFRDRTIVERDLRERVTRIAALQGELRVVHLRAHLLTRAILSADQVARYDELRGYTTSQPPHQEHQHTH